MGKSTVSGSGTLLTLILSMSFKKSWEGEKSITLFASDSVPTYNSGLRGRWIVGPPSRSDFNGDRKPDIIWRNASTGDVYVWFMDGDARTGGSYLPAVQERDWKIAGMADFNQDRIVDILWRNETTGDNYVWYMIGNSHTGGDYLPRLGKNWKVAAAGE
jgi:hypothetical protein